MKYSELKQIILLRRRLSFGQVWNDDGAFGSGDWWADVPFGDDELNIALTWEGDIMPERVAFINYHLDVIDERDELRGALRPFADVGANPDTARGGNDWGCSWECYEQAAALLQGKEGSDAVQESNNA